MRNLFQKFWTKIRDDEKGVALAEAGLIFPLLMTILLGTFDIGNGILANQKTIRASQVTADLITRERTVTDADITEIVEAGELSLVPFSSEGYGVDIISFRFDEDAQTEILWRETVNVSALASPESNVAALAEANSGVVMVAAQYQFEPLFAGFLINDFTMQELAFARGRQSSTVPKE